SLVCRRGRWRRPRRYFLEGRRRDENLPPCGHLSSWQAPPNERHVLAVLVNRDHLECHKKVIAAIVVDSFQVDVPLDCFAASVQPDFLVFEVDLRGNSDLVKLYRAEVRDAILLISNHVNFERDRSTAIVKQQLDIVPMLLRV